MAYDASLSRTGALADGAAVRTCGTAGTRAALREHAWSAFDRRDRIGDWDALARAAGEPNPFFESWFLLPALRALDRDGRVTLLTLTISGRLVGVMPVERSRDYYGHPLPHLRTFVHPNCFCGLPLVADGFEGAFWSALLDWSDSHAGLSLFLHLPHVPAQGPLHDALAAELSRRPRPAATVFREERALLASSLSAQDYFEASLSTRKRKELRRQERRLAEDGTIAVERLTDYSSVASWTREFLDLEVRGWKGEAGSALHCDPATRQLFQRAIAGAAARGRLERLALRLDGKPIAMLANFLTPPGAYSFKTAFDEGYARCSPGVLLQRENLALLGREDIAWTDSCAAANHSMIDHIWRERRVMERRNIGIGGGLRRHIFAALARLETGRNARDIA